MNRTIRTAMLAVVMVVSNAQSMFAQDALFVDDKGRVGIGALKAECTLTISNLRGKNVFGIDNDAYFSAKNSGHAYENYFWPRGADNKMYLNYGSAGFVIRNNSSIPAMIMTPDGNVGIGMEPNAMNKLQLTGNLHMLGNTIYFRGGNPTDRADFVRWSEANDNTEIAGWRGVALGFTLGSTAQELKFTPVLTVDYNRNVDVHGSIYSRLSGNLKGTSRMGMFTDEFIGMELESRDHNAGRGGVVKFFTCGTHTAYSREVMRIDERGRVGIGTNDPQAMLDVRGYVDYYVNKFGYVDPGGAGYHGGAQNRKASIRATDDIITKMNFTSYSDMRIKKDFVHSDNAKDLATLNRLRVTDYKYIDNRQYGNDSKKGFLAQEVEQVFPEAISRGTDFIPDIFATPEKVTEHNGNITCSMAKPHQLKDGDIVRVITKQGPHDRPVTVISGTTFSFTDTTADNYHEAFVFGKQVNDFRMIDYDRLFTLNVSATQRLSQEVDMLKAENERLRKESAQNRDKYENMESRLEAIEDTMEASAKIVQK